MKTNKRRIARPIMTILSVLAVGFIFLHSIMDAETSSAESGWMRDILNSAFRAININIVLDDFAVRKLAHFTEYAVMGALLSVTVFLYVSKRLKTFLLTLPIGLAVAVIDETIQMFSEGRSPQFTDVLIDFFGVLIAALIIQLILYLIDRHRLKKEGNGIERSDTK